eukprot:TRINITY_DN4322_c2_g1_i1.p1 TRINITY_DN4322_c2_g1~~TRINITY_DN4322_c2_g1_i1.p1  ORF type:complete len:686 (+),score=100.73 TRINITY_DN4322_c2_g1_i1:220-2277(+)
MDTTIQRISTIFQHLTPSLAASFQGPFSSPVHSTHGHQALHNADIDVSHLVKVLYEDYNDEVIETRKELLEVFKDPLFRPRYNMSMEEHRDLTTNRVRRVAAANLLKTEELTSKYNKFAMVKETLAYIDFSLQVKDCVHFGLFAGSISALGTEKHKRHFPAIDSLEMFGSFALSELGHGSNVRGIETIAIYDHSTNTFVINTPTPTAQKCWIGNAARDGLYSVVFANLIIGEENHGIHPFIVPLRDPTTKKPLEGIFIGDCGPKIGINGVDNGRIAFKDVRVPYDNLLNKFGDVIDGKYVTPIPHKGTRFNSMLEALVGGRVVVGCCSLSGAKLGLYIAIKYAESRRQFSPNQGKEPEILLNDWYSHQRLLMPALATTYAYQILANHVKIKFQNHLIKEQREMFLLAAGFKSMVTWHKSETLQIARECCGGQGFLAENMIGVMRADSDIDVTYEGQNTVLMQAVSKALLTEFISWFKGKKPITSMLKYTWQNGYVGRYFRNQFWLVQSLSSDDLRNPEVYLDAFAFREFKLLRQLAKSLREKTKVERLSSFQAWNTSMELILNLAKAYVERITLEQFILAIQKAEKGPTPAPHATVNALRLVCSLFCMSRMEKDMAWFLENKFITPSRAKLVHTEITKLCSEVRQIAISLINGFDIPPIVITAPIANDWVKTDIVQWIEKPKASL